MDTMRCFLNRLPSVAVLCVSRERGVDGSAHGAARALLLHSDETEEAEEPGGGGGGGGDLRALADARLAAGSLLLLRWEAGPAEDALRAALADVERGAAAERGGAEPLHAELELHERVAPGASWRRAAAVAVRGSRALAPPPARPALQVRIDNLTAESAARWAADGAAPAEPVQGPGLALLALAAAALAVLSGAVLAARARRGGRRGAAREAPLLAVADFSFPADERRVGDGIETMLSCWLRRLHEFGGPEPAAPPEELAPPRAPSLPSSTCSVNRVAVDRRTRFKVST